MEFTEVAEWDIEHWLCVEYWAFCISYAVFMMLMQGSYFSSVRVHTVVFLEFRLCALNSESLSDFILVPSACTAAW